MRYRATKTPRELGGTVYVFASGHEAEVCTDLWMQQKAKHITQLQFHPKFVFVVNGVKVGKYTPDATFVDDTGTLRVIDAKGFKKSPKTGKMLPRVNQDFSLRKNLMLACFGLEVEIK